MQAREATRPLEWTGPPYQQQGQGQGSAGFGVFRGKKGSQGTGLGAHAQVNRGQVQLSAAKQRWYRASGGWKFVATSKAAKAQVGRQTALGCHERGEDPGLMGTEQI